MLFGIAAVHSVEIGREQGRFVATGAGADFEDDVGRVGRVLRQQLDLQIVFERLEAFVDRTQLLFRQRRHFTVAGTGLDHRRQIVAFGRRPAQRLDGRHNRVKL